MVSPGAREPRAYSAIENILEIISLFFFFFAFVSPIDSGNLGVGKSWLKIENIIATQFVDFHNLIPSLVPAYILSIQAQAHLGPRPHILLSPS